MTDPSPIHEATASTPVNTDCGRPADDTLASIRLGIWVLVMIAMGFTLYLASSLILPILVAGMLALLLSPAVHGLNRLRLPLPVAAGIVLVCAVGTFAALVIHLGTPVQEWVAKAPLELRRLEYKLDRLLEPVNAVRDATEKMSDIANPDKGEKREVVVERGTSGGSMVDITVDTTVIVLSTVMLLYFLLASGDLLVRRIVELAPERRDKMRMIEILRTIQHEVGQYYATITVVNIALGVATALAMWLLDMPTPAVWGLAIALLNFLPYLGPMIATVLLAAVALLTFDSPLQALAPPAAFLLLNFIQDQLVLPFLLGKRLALNPVVIFLWVLFWAWMWGMGGLLLAVPLLVAVRICAERVPALEPLAIVLSRPSPR